MFLTVTNTSKLHQEIAHYLDDKSICALRLACKTTQASVDGHYETFWHKHFLNIFDIPRDVSTMNSFKYKEKYQLRKSVLKRKGTNYKTGYFKKEKIAAEILIELAMGKCAFRSRYLLASRNRL